MHKISWDLAISACKWWEYIFFNFFSCQIFLYYFFFWIFALWVPLLFSLARLQIKYFHVFPMNQWLGNSVIFFFFLSSWIISSMTSPSLSLWVGGKLGLFILNFLDSSNCYFYEIFWYEFVSWFWAIILLFSYCLRVIKYWSSTKPYQTSPNKRKDSYFVFTTGICWT